MSGVATSDVRKPINIFISAATDEFAADREALDRLLEQFGVIHVQRDYPSSLASGNKIAEAIKATDVIICLIGHRYGAPLPPKNRPAGAWDGCSWTQWEYAYARTVIRAHPEKSLVVFIDKKAPSCTVDTRQATFRERAYQDEKDSHEGLFFFPYLGTANLVSSCEAMIRDPKSSPRQSPICILAKDPPRLSSPKRRRLEQIISRHLAARSRCRRTTAPDARAESAFYRDA